MTKEHPIIFSGAMVRVLTRARINLLSGPLRSVLPCLGFAEELARNKTVIEDFEWSSVCRLRADRHLTLPRPSNAKRRCGCFIPVVAVVGEALEIHFFLQLSWRILA
ncbi:hypothetical protein [Cupriavidus sp. DF5525]|uniref:hypothetical protein n=1 Tax=Cupriavidus sp. DF5525 TaxID=3160989 RepID=UPI0035A88E06